MKSSLAAFFNALLKAGYAGDCTADAATRLINATDNSIYQVMPQAVLTPRRADDLNIIMQAAQDFPDLHFVPRGGGTGTNGQALNDGIVIDASRHLNRILEIDTARGFVRVEPGVVLEQLNAVLRPHGYFFPPEVSPNKSATLGGMVSTDACGKGSCIYGKTGDYVLSLTCVLPDGREIKTDNYQHDALKNIIRAEYAQAVQGIPHMPRGISGYNIPGSYDAQNDAVNLNRLIAGSEGSLALIKEMTFKIIPKPKHHAIVAIAYDDFDKALRHVSKLLTYGPAGIETIDDRILELARGDILWSSIRDVFPSLPENIKAMHFVEFEYFDEADLKSAIGKITADLPIDPAILGFHPASAAAEIAAIIALRRKCVGLLGNMAGAQRPIPFMEDTAVPPARLADYIADLRRMLESHGLVCGMFGHSDAGCLHVRPALDMRDTRDEKFIRILTDETVALLKKHGGILWGEHGKGMRSAYTAELVGTNYYALMQKIKQHFDPQQRLNRGKIAVVPGDRLIEIDGAPLRGHFDRQIKTEKLSGFEKSVQCNGNGQCFSLMADDTMCPSYKITRDRRHSPKGRAVLLREWARLESVDAPAARAFSGEVYSALKGCLSCKACTSTCPIHVNIPDMKSQFLSRYYQGKTRPLRDYMIALAERVTPLLAALPFALPDIFGLRDMPKPPKTSLKILMQKHGFQFFSDETVRGARNPVLIIQDAYTSYYEPQLVISILSLLRKLDYTPLVVPYRESGKSFHVRGFLSMFRKIAAQNIIWLEGLAALGNPMIGIDPSMTLVWRDEYKMVKTAPDYKVQLLQEFLADAPEQDVMNHKIYQLFLHCTEKTARPDSGKAWQFIFRKFGLQLNVIETGCCGMAGVYGHESEHYENSKGLYQLSWQSRVGDNALVTGYSCRSQVKRFTHIRQLHPAELLDTLL